MGQGVGRPPKPGDRYPSGQLKKTEIAPALLARIRTAAERGQLDARFGSQVGRLFLCRELTAAEAATAFRMAEIYGRFEANNGLSRSVRSPSYEAGSRGGGANAPDPDKLARIAQDNETWQALQEHLLKNHTRGTRALLELLCVDDRAIHSADLPDVIEALHEIAAVLNAGPRKKRRKKRAALMVVGRAHVPKAAAPPPARRTDHEREAWLKVQRKLSPKMTEPQLQEAYGIFVAMKDRGAFEASKVR